MDNYTIFYIYLASVFIVILGVAFYLVRRIFLERGLISRSLGLKLILVRFPPIIPSGETNLQQIREKIALMEQFYSYLQLIKGSWWQTFIYGRNIFALELTVPQVGEELSFYVAVPRHFISSVEKIIQGVFPEAYLEESRDYNIFNPEGAAAGAFVTLKKNSYHPIRTYQKLEGDPMGGITNVFTKLAEIGEGAVLQIVARPAGKKWHAILNQEAKLKYEGKKKKNLFDVILELVQSETDKNAQKRIEETKRLTPLEEEAAKAFNAKAGKSLFETNIRLISSAKNQIRAEEILRELGMGFEQFTDPNLNSVQVSKAERKTLKKLIFDFSFRNFDERKIVVLGSEELTSIFHFPNVLLQTPKLRAIKAREGVPPASLPKEGILLGYNVFRDKKTDVRMLDEDRRRHLYIVGQTGTGKTVLLKNLIQQDIENGKGVCFIDPHGDTVEEILGLIPKSRMEDLIYFNPGDVERPMGLNMLEYDPNFPEQKTFIVNELFGIFQKLYGAVPESLGPIFEQYFRNSTMLVMDDPSSGNTLLEISRVMSEKAFRDLKVSRAKNIVVKKFWIEIAEKSTGEQSLANYVPYITSKFDVFLANEIMRPIITQEKSSFSFRDVMDTGKILLVNLSKGRLGDINSSLIGLIIVGKLTMAALSRTDVSQDERRDFYLYIDEFQNVTTDSIAAILSEARKYKLDLIIAHQFVKQLQENIKNAVFGNVGSMAAFRIGSEDGEFMEKQFAPVFKAQDLLNIDNYNCYVRLLVGGQTTTPFSMKTYPPAKVTKETISAMKEISRTKFGRPRDEVEKEIKERYENGIQGS